MGTVESTHVPESETERPKIAILISTFFNTHCLLGIIVRASHSLFQGSTLYSSLALSTRDPFLYSPRAKNFHIFKRLFFKKRNNEQ